MSQPKLKSNRLAHLQRYWCRVILACLCSSLFLTACEGNTATPTPTSPPASLNDWQARWLKGLPCRAPCWEGITPGKTTASEALDILKQSPIIAPAYIGISESPRDKYGYVSWDWLNIVNGSKSGGRAEYRVQPPDQIIYVIRPAYQASYKLSDVITAYGEPSHIRVMTGTKFLEPPRTPYYGKHTVYSIRLVYLSQGFQIFTSLDDKTNFNRAMLLSDPEFFAPGIDGFNTAFSDINIVPWEGFKGFDFYCRVKNECLYYD